MSKRNLSLPGKARIKLFLGEFGSGKTELAVNYAIQLQATGRATAVVDLDLIKPCYRTRENSKLLAQKGVQLVAPAARLSATGLPVLPENLIRVLNDQSCQVVVDVGGGEAAIVLGQLHNHFCQLDYQALLVVNTYRPFSQTIEEILAVRAKVEEASRLQISGVVSNANLGKETTTAQVQAGIALVSAAAAKMQLPLEWVVVPEWLPDFSCDYPVFYLQPCTHYPWADVPGDF